MAAHSNPRRARVRSVFITAATLVTVTIGGAIGAGAATAASPPDSAARTGHATAGARPSVISGIAARGSPGTADGTNYATRAHTAYLRAHAAANHMGGSLSGGRSAGRAARPATPRGVDPVAGDDVSSRQGSGVDWGRAAASGTHFVYVKATEGSYYTNPDFSYDYGRAYGAGMIHGAYHFAIPSYSSGTAQADFFSSNGGGWSADGRTLPGALDIEFNPYGKQWCYGLSQSAMVSWISAFIKEYHARTSRWAVIYTNYRWWKTCTGNYGGFAANDPLWIANYGSSAGTLPAGWSNYTFWQYADSGTFPGDQDVFLGAPDRLRALADNTQ